MAARNRSQGQNQGNQQAPGRDIPNGDYSEGQPDINAAIGGGLPVGNAVFRGAQQTIGAQPSQPGQPAYTPPQGNTGISGMGDPMGTRAQQQAPQAPLQRFGGQSPEDFMRQQLSGVQYGPQGLGSLTDAFKQHGLTVNTASDGGVRGRVTDDTTGDFWDVLKPTESGHWWTDLRENEFQVGGRQSAPQGGGYAPQGPARMPMPGVMQAITQKLPGYNQGDTNDTYATRLREQVMKAISNPQLAGLLGSY